MSLSRPGRAVLALAALFVAAQAALFLEDRLHLTRLNLHDATTYLLLGRNLAEGTGFSASPGLEHPTVRLWLPGFPAFLAGWIAAFGTNLLVLNGAMILVAAGAIAATYRLAKAIAPPRTAAWLTALVLVHPLTFSLAHQTLADLPGLALGMLALSFLPRLGERSRGAAAAIGALAGASALVKGHNTGLAVAFAFLAWRDRRRPRERGNAWIALAAFLAVWGSWSLRNALLHGEGYSGYTVLQLVLRTDPDAAAPITPGQFWRRIRTVFVYNLPRSLAACVLPWPGAWLTGDSEAELLAAGALSLLVAIGLVRRLREGLGPVEAYWLGALLLLVPTTSKAGGLRHMAPFLPVTLWLVFQGYGWIAGGRRPLLAAGAGIALASSLFATARFTAREVACPEGTADLRDLAAIARLERSGPREFVFGPRADLLAVRRGSLAWHRLEEWREGWRSRPDLEPVLIVPRSWIERNEWEAPEVVDPHPPPGPCPEEFRSPPWRLRASAGPFGLYRRDPPTAPR